MLSHNLNFTCEEKDIIIIWVNESMRGENRYRQNNVLPAITRAKRAVYFIGSTDMFQVCFVFTASIIYCYCIEWMNEWLNVWNTFAIFRLHRRTVNGTTFYSTPKESTRRICYRRPTILRSTFAGIFKTIRQNVDWSHFIATLFIKF